MYLPPILKRLDEENELFRAALARNDAECAAAHARAIWAFNIAISAERRNQARVGVLAGEMRLRV